MNNQNNGNNVLLFIAETVFWKSWKKAQESVQGVKSTCRQYIFQTHSHDCILHYIFAPQKDPSTKIKCNSKKD